MSTRRWVIPVAHVGRHEGGFSIDPVKMATEWAELIAAAEPTNAAYIVAFSPDVALSLLDTIEELQTQNRHLQDVCEKLGTMGREEVPAGTVARLSATIEELRDGLGFAIRESKRLGRLNTALYLERVLEGRPNGLAEMEADALASKESSHE
jgi:hypothetical protein